MIMWLTWDLKRNSLHWVGKLCLEGWALVWIKSYGGFHCYISTSLRKSKSEQNMSWFFEVFYKECVHKWVERIISSCQTCSGVAPSLTSLWHFFWALPKVSLGWHYLRELSWSRLLKEISLWNQCFFWLYSKVKCLCILCFPIMLFLFCAFLKI